MNRLPMSAAAGALLRGLLARAPQDRDRILLTAYRSTDWQSLTFVGERHELSFRVLGPDAPRVVALITYDLAEAEFSLGGHLLADIAVAGEPRREGDGSISFSLEALTIEE